MDQGANAVPVSCFDKPSLNGRLDVKLESLSHIVQEDRLVLGHFTKIQ